MKYFVFSDVHGDYSAMIDGLSEVGYDPFDKNHTIISCGDNFGEGENGEGSMGIYLYLNKKRHANKPICLRGNHENLLLDIVKRGYLQDFDFQCGEDKTVGSFCDNPLEKEFPLVSFDSGVKNLKRLGVIDWILSMPYFFKTKHFLFLHSFFPYDEKTDKLYVEDFEAANDELWEKIVWVQTPPLIDKFLSRYPNGVKTPDGKYLGIVFGHWSVAGLHRKYDIGHSSKNCFEPFIYRKAKLIGLDTSTPKTGKLNVLVIEDELREEKK